MVPGFVTALMVAWADDRINRVESSVTSVNVPDPETTSHLEKHSPTLMYLCATTETVSPADAVRVVVVPSIVTFEKAPAAKTRTQRTDFKKVPT